MKTRTFLLMPVFLLLPVLLAANDKQDSENQQLRKSSLTEPANFEPDKSSFPMPFNELNNSKSNSGVSTGYYFVDSDDEAPDYWRPSPSIIDTTTNPSNWLRIEPGPRTKPQSYWYNNPEGLPFFRNPAYPLSDRNFFRGPTDSTDDAFAGPMPIGFNFFFNGLKYDSFYVSTNGLIALTNARYHYNTAGSRIIPNGQDDCYNKYSMDWFVSGRDRTGDGLADTLADDFGYIYSVCGGSPYNDTAGIRKRGGPLNQDMFSENKSALIAPFFGDLHLSQYNAAKDTAEDWSKVFYYRNPEKDRLIIYFIRLMPVRELNTPFGEYEGLFNLRPDDDNYIGASAQVTIDRRDSSVLIVYERFDGVAVINGRGVGATTVFRYNTTVGVHGFARHTNNDSLRDEQKHWAGEYGQYTHYFSEFEQLNKSYQNNYPHNYLAIRFKQWKNSLRTVDVQLRVRRTDLNADLDFTETVSSKDVNNHEILAGEERIGAFQPVGIFQNLTNDIQGINGVNYSEQDFKFRARCRVSNEASGRIIYNRLIRIDSTALASDEDYFRDSIGNPYVNVDYVRLSSNNGNYTADELEFPGNEELNGVPPYGSARVFFPPFDPNEFVNNHIGRLKLQIIAETKYPDTGNSIFDEWAFDDTVSRTLFSMKRLDDFSDDGTSFHIIDRKPLPNTLKWVNIGAEVVSGEDVSEHPLAPRGEFSPSNNADFNFTDPDYRNWTWDSPTIKMNRLTLDNQEPETSPGGDELRSFPIDLRGRFGAVLSIGVQRNSRRDDWPRGFGDQELVGPEPRVVINQDPYAIWTLDKSVSSQPDELVVEFAYPSSDGVTGITNIPEHRWRIHPRRGGANPVTNMPALSIFGAGGYMVGWLESDRDSALSRPAKPRINGLRPDIYDDGFDFEYKRHFISIPDTFIKAKNEGAKNFRFRVKMMARDNRKCIACIPDDDDPYFIDNVKISFPCECTDVELTSVKILWPYTIAPASQAMKIPVRVTISNNTSVAVPPFRVKVRIFKNVDDPAPIWCRTENIPFMTGRTNYTIPIQNWDARKTGDGEYCIKANLMFNYPDQDLEPRNDSNFSFVTLKFGDVFAYDPVQNPRNDVPDNQFTGIPGRGLSLLGFSYGGMGSINGNSGEYDEDVYGAGYHYIGMTGQIAMKFTLYQRDTVYGYRAFFGSLNQAFEDISLAVYRDANGQPSSTRVPNTLIYKYRGFDDIRHEGFWDEYVTYELPAPITLDAGSYWFAIGELGETGIELGASKSRMGMRTMSIYLKPPNFQTVNPVGEQGISLMIDKSFRRGNNTGNLINDNRFAYENTRGSGQWKQFMPTIGNPGYAHLHHFGLSNADNYTLTLTRGTWIPMIRPYFGERSSGYDMRFDDCYIPVELINFDGLSYEKGIELFWSTATEINNDGFYIEKKEHNENEWKTMTFVKGAGNSNKLNQYNSFDADVNIGNTYDYRLRQVDFDGTMTCDDESPVISILYEGNPELRLGPCRPNPASQYTLLSYSLPTESEVYVEIVDIFGNKVKTLTSGIQSSGSKTVEWNLTDDAGRRVPSGTYFCRLKAGNEVRTEKITVVR